MSAISIKAVIVGAIADVVTSTILGIPFGVYVVASSDLSKLHGAALRSAVLASIHGSPVLYALQLTIGAGASILGGYVAARLAKSHIRLNGVLASWLCVGIGVSALFYDQEVMAPAVLLALILATPLLYLLGASLRSAPPKQARTPA